MVFVLAFLSCKETVLEKPDQLIEKATMVDIMYDLTLLDALKYQTSAVTDSLKINSTRYVLKKYKIDSLQFARSNSYYASNYEEYSIIINQVKDKLTASKIRITAEIKAKNKKKKIGKMPVLKNQVPDSLELKQRKKL